MAEMQKSGWAGLPGSDITGAMLSPEDDGPKLKEKNGHLWQWVADEFSDAGGSWEDVGKVPGAAGEGRGRNDALSAAQAALSGFLQAQSLADARKMSAMENFMKLSKYALPEGAQFAPGYEPGGMANTLAARQGMTSYRPPAITPRQVNPGDVKGDIPPEILAMIGNISRAGGG